MNPWAVFKSEIIEHCLSKKLPTIDCVEIATFAEEMVAKHLLITPAINTTPEALDAMAGPCKDSFFEWVTRKSSL